MNNYSEALRNIRLERPLVHCISNIVTANDCANLLLAVGASPMMAQAREEMADISAISSAAVLNFGTPEGSERFELCALRGMLANRIGQPVILDPVGVGASSWRLVSLRAALKRFHPSIVRVNLGEALALLGKTGRERGVDSGSSASDEERGTCAGELARQLHATVLLSGEKDFVSNGVRTERIAGGSAMTSMVTGCGCMLSVLCGAFAAVGGCSSFEAAAMASEFWKTCAERAEREIRGRGPAAFRAALIDAAFTLSTQ